jgi:hypothetical protein
MRRGGSGSKTLHSKIVDKTVVTKRLQGFGNVLFRAVLDVSMIIDRVVFQRSMLPQCNGKPVASQVSKSNVLFDVSMK